MIRKNLWRLRQLILEPDLVERVDSWHGGQGSAVYSLVSTAHNDFVSLSMIDRALDELRSVYRTLKPGKDKRNLNDVIGDLSGVRLDWQANTAREAGASTHDSGYDHYDHGLDAAEEEDMVDKGEWANPRKAMQPIRKGKRTPRRCKMHGDHSYDVCPKDGHQFCSEYWKGCPRCGGQIRRS